MGKIIKKLRPENYWCIGEHESWFSDMAVRGFHLKKVGLFVHFTQDEPRQMRYRIDVANANKITTEKKDAYSKRGWDYVTSYGKFNVFSSLVELNATELYSDPVEQAYSLEHLDKRLIKTALIMPILISIMIGFVLFGLFIGWTPYINLVNGGIIQQLTTVVVILWLGYNSLQATVSIHAMREKLLQGKPIDHSAPWKRKHKNCLIVSNIVITIAVCGAILPMIKLASMKTENLPIDKSDLPIVRLTDIEQNADLVRNSAYMDKDSDSDRGNRYSYNWSLLAPLHYESREEGFIVDEILKDSKERYSPNINTTVYKLNLSFMNEGLLSDLIKRYARSYRGEEYLEIAHPDFDKIITCDADSSKQVFAYKGKGVMYISYYGDADMDSVIEAAAEKISLISD